MKKIAVVSGGSSGIGLEITKALVLKNYFVYTMSRREFLSLQEDKVKHISLDITDEEKLTRAFADIWEKEGRIDLAVCASGFGISGAVEFTSLEDAKRQMDVNFFGAFLFIRVAASYMRPQSFGKIFVITSIAGEIAIPFQAFYSASKAALGKLLEAFRAELQPFGVDCALIMPGDVATPFTAARDKSNAGDDIYDGRISKSVSKMEKDEQKGMNPERLGKFVVSLAEKRKIGFFYPYDWTYAFLLLLYRILPRRLGLFIVKKLYA
ncbi:SDR family NAD(P)-dependent oxidoreductase [Treponema sp. OMZ 792]|uniref:SDR family NAD(P)-dependent oxidoreductase n=1 Tax=unclassified Treponema TaxID=2638727 RepID=UPI0020A5F9E0|nr:MULTISPECIES: SDR family NAD(P)-dependent oxidoreductase [unclassified Treponema]UTC75254.1 SDR family NAD(P)-dependent oxidoreductase [Treponema sp. OMZ 792]UTC79259.1 SDR family NAD(P)-dependent oxidoreductase [Treponema sp. OMZ 798]